MKTRVRNTRLSCMAPVASLGIYGLEVTGYGPSLCAATIALPGAEAGQRRMPMSLVVEPAFGWPDGCSEMRILFSTDPGIALVQTQ